MKPITKILVANRGEIAVRIFHSAKKMNIATLAIFDPKEPNALYVQLADEAVELPAGFMDIKSIVEIAKQNNADAIHPGYGFLSENTDFARACEQADIVFIGPPGDAISKMGDKSMSREYAAKAGVPMLQGFKLDGNRDYKEAELYEIAAKVGYPIMLKSSAGGGGKGMTNVDSQQNLYQEYLRIKSEAMRLFNNSDIVIERYLPRARHIEVQILGNCEGKNYAIGDRDCSLQRHNQKVIEEAPAPGLSPKTRENLHKSAVALADHINYRNAGTLEFLYEAERDEFYFLEMNTRLQVEHPVTEMTSGLDLVAEQILIASGVKTSYENIPCNGHALEARICAELPDGTYRPSTGTILIYHEPPKARCDSGITEGSVVSSNFDNMLAKCIVHGSDRREAIENLKQALREYHVGGVQTNIPLLKQIIGDKTFGEAKMFTRYLADGFTYRGMPSSPVEAAGAVYFQKQLQQNKQYFGAIAGFYSVKPLKQEAASWS